MEPGMRMLRRAMDVSSEDWELKQQAVAAKARLSNSQAEVLRDYRLLALSRGDMEREYFSQLQCVFNSP
eukprot:2228972-Pyramimonas_sp.AAC.1